MSQLPVMHMTLYKHGVGYFRRRGPVEGEAITLTFRREEMDDLLKSLTVVDHSGGQVQGVDYDTPQSQQERLAGCSIILNDTRSLRDLLVALRGRRGQVLATEAGEGVSGLLLGLDEDPARPLENSVVSILEQETQKVVVLPLNRVEGVTLQDETAAADLRFFLKTALGQETHRSITIRLSPGEHDLEVSYIAPAPTWRVSYRLVVEVPPAEETKPGQEIDGLLQGWGIFDNRLEEDLEDITLSLTAGMPISFVYDLYTPYTPQRPEVRDESRVAAKPVMFEGATKRAKAVPDISRGMGAGFSMADAMVAAEEEAPAPPSMEEIAASVESKATGKAMGELFQYNVSTPVTVGRGQSAMVPIVGSRLSFKKDLIYNGRKMAKHPVATLRFTNGTGLTLERGPVTVLENGEYVGEAVLPFTADESEAVVSYAVELGLHVKEETKTSSQLQGLKVQKGYLLQERYDIRRTTYSVENRTPQAKRVLLEHVVGSGYTVFDTPDPAEKTLNTHRYAVSISPGKTEEFTVSERHRSYRHEEMTGLTYKGLQKYFKDKLLDRRTYQELKGLLDTWAEVESLKQEIEERKKERQEIYKAQEQAQKNMTVLSNRGEEGQLRSQYVQQIARSEEKLAQIEQAIEAAQAKIKQKLEQGRQIIAALAEK